MRTPTKNELYRQIEALQDENLRLHEKLEHDKRREWERRRPEAVEAFFAFVGKVFPGAIIKVTLEHIDAGGYWFTFELVNDSKRQTYCVRHTDLI